MPIDHIDIDSVNEWASKKRKTGLSWTTIKDALRTMQGILSVFSKDKEPPFSQNVLRIPEAEKLKMQIDSREKISFSWADAERIATNFGRFDALGEARREHYSALILLAAASGMRSGELLALRVCDGNLEAHAIQVKFSSDQRRGGKIGPCKNVMAYRTVHLCDAEGKKAMARLKRLLELYPAPSPNALVFRFQRGGPLLETTVLNQGLYLALESLGLPRAGLHAFRRGCNRRWELAGLMPAVIQQQMGHASAAMTRLYSGRIPDEQRKAAFSMKNGRSVVQLENMENGATA